ncbi:hypothetical protein JTE90_027502 [Oedothorax gibbosus]|uniref:Uncharacterized protein n=1 Tax=Oedothorax gibbosus TaxID=931172 RepID=A0AAV6TGD4_9ARAC|nr:hypothetical protein JTE90_027502 [Oedothorax gibbosus]
MYRPAKQPTESSSGGWARYKGSALGARGDRGFPLWGPARNGYGPGTKNFTSPRIFKGQQRRNGKTPEDAVLYENSVPIPTADSRDTKSFKKR